MSLSSILNSFKAGIKGAFTSDEPKETKSVGARKPTTFDASVKLRDTSGMSISDQIKAQNEPLIKDATLSKAPSKLESFESELSVNPITGTRETGGRGSQAITMARNAPSALSNLLKSYVPANTMIGGLDVEKAAGAIGNVVGGIPAAIPSVGVGLAESTEGVAQAKGVKDTAIKLTSVPVKTLMPLMNLMPGVMAFQLGTQATGLDEKTNKGIESAKSGVSSGLQKTGLFSPEEADELGSNAIDMFQLFLSFFGGAQSSKAGNKAKVSEIARQEKMSSQLKTIEKDARASGLSRADAKQFAKETAPMVQKSTPTTLLSDAQVLTSNLKNIGIDIAANSIIPVLGLAYENYKNSGNDDVVGAIREAAIQVGAMAIPGAKVKSKGKLSEQLKLDVDTAKAPTPETLPSKPARMVEIENRMKQIEDEAVNTLKNTKDIKSIRKNPEYSQLLDELLPYQWSEDGVYKIYKETPQSEIDAYSRYAKSKTPETLIPRETPVAPVKEKTPAIIEGFFNMNDANKQEYIEKNYNDILTTRKIDGQPAPDSAIQYAEYVKEGVNATQRQDNRTDEQKRLDANEQRLDQELNEVIRTKDISEIERGLNEYKGFDRIEKDFQAGRITKDEYNRQYEEYMNNPYSMAEDVHGQMQSIIAKYKEGRLVSDDALSSIVQFIKGGIDDMKSRPDKLLQYRLLTQALADKGQGLQADKLLQKAKEMYSGDDLEIFMWNLKSISDAVGKPASTKLETPQTTQKPLSTILQEPGTTRITDKKNGIVDYEIVDGTMKIDNIMSNESGAGQGTKLLKKAEAEAKKQGANRVQLTAAVVDETRTTKEQLDAFYTKNGYTKIPGTERGYEKVLPQKKAKPLSKILEEGEVDTVVADTTGKLPGTEGADFMKDTGNQLVFDGLTPDDIRQYAELTFYRDNGRNSYGNVIKKSDKAYIKKSIKDINELLSIIEGDLTNPDDIARLRQVALEQGKDFMKDTGNGEPTNIAKQLGDIMKSFSLDNAYVSGSKNILNKAGTIGGYLEKGFSNVGDRIINLRNITQSARNSAVLFANKILESVGVDKTTPTFTRKVDLNDNTVAGGVTPNEGTIIGRYSEVKKVLDNIVPDAIKNFVGKKAVPGLETQAKAEYLYEINKGNPDKINELFTPEEQAIIQSRIEARDKASAELADYLVELGFLKDKDLADNYVRYVLSEAGRSQLKLDKKVPVVIGGKEYVFENIDQALTSLLARRQKGDNRVADEMEAVISSILKEKSTGIDKLRVHSPTVQLLSYSMEIGKLLQNKAVLDNFRVFMKDSEGGKLPTEEKKFISDLFPEIGANSEKLENIIGINRRDAGFIGASKNAMSGLTRFISGPVILAGRVGTAIQPFFSSVPKGGLVAIKNMFTGAPVSLIGIRDRSVMDVLDGNGFIPDYQAFDTSPSSKIEKGMHWVAAESSGRTPELAAKVYTSLTEMRRVLNDNGVKTSASPIDIAKKWETWARDPKNRDNYLIAQDRIQETLDWMGGSTIFNKSMVDLIRKTNFQALTGYVNGQVNKGLTDMGRAIGMIETGKGQKGEAVRRLLGTGLVWGSVVALAYMKLKDENPEASDDAVLDMAIQYGNRQAGNPVQGAYALTSGLTDSPLFSGMGLIKDLMSVGFSYATQDEGRDMKLQRLADNFMKMQGGLSTYETITGGDLSNRLSEMLGTATTRDITAAGNARGVKDQGLSAALLNWKPQQLMSNFLYGKMSEAEIANRLEMKDSLAKDAIVNTAGLAKDWLRKVAQPLQDSYKTLVPGQGLDYGRMQNVVDVYNKIESTDTVGSFMGKLGITEPLIHKLVETEIVELMMTEKGKVTKKTGLPTSGNELAAYVSFDEGEQKYVVKNFGAMMDEIEKQNPYLHNQIISGMTNLLEENQRRDGGFKVDRNTYDNIKSLISTSNARDDSVIAAVSKENPNSTAFAEAMWDTYGRIMDTKSPTDKDVKKGVTFLNDMMAEIYQSGPWSAGIEKSTALKSFSILPQLLETANQYGWNTVWTMMKDAPFLDKALHQGLKYRGWENNIANQKNLSTIPTGQTQATTSGGTGLSGMLGLSTPIATVEGGVIPSKDKKKPAKLSDKFLRVETKPQRVMSLSELLRMKK